MPNYVTNHLIVVAPTKERQDEVMSKIYNSSGVVDFELILPMPKILKQKSTSIFSFKNKRSELEQQAHEARCEEETGFKSWFDWRCYTWGCKWNASNIVSPTKQQKYRRWYNGRGRFNKKYKPERIYRHRIAKKRWGRHIKENGYPNFAVFETPWNRPKGVFEALTQKFPDVRFYLRYADEDLGCNTGEVEYLAGQVIKEKHAGRWADMSDEERTKWQKFAYEVRYPNESYVLYQLDDDYRL